MLSDLAYDFAALAVDIQIIIAVTSRRMTTGFHNRAFLSILCVNIATAILSIALNLVQGSALSQFVLENLLITVQQAIMPLFAIFIIGITERREAFKTHLKWLFSLPYILLLIMVWIINPINGALYTLLIGTFTIGPWNAVLVMPYLIYLGISTFYLVKYRNSVEDRVLFSMTFLVPVVAIFSIIQQLHPGINLQCFILACVCLFYNITIQRPETIIDVESGLNRLSVFMSVMKRALLGRRRITLHLLKIEHYNQLNSSLTVDFQLTLLRTIAEAMREAIHECGCSREVELFYLNKGLFAFCIRESYRDVVEHLAETSDEMINAAIEENPKLTITPSFYRCIVNVPEDISEYQAITPFINGFEEIIPKPGKLYRLSDFKGRESVGIYMNIGSILERALQHDEIAVYFNPIYSNRKRRIVGAEADISIRDTRYGVMNAETIATAAERLDMVERLTMAVFDKVCRFIAGASFNETGMEFVTMKLSIQVLKNQYICEQLVNRAQRYGVKPSQIILELAETCDSEDWNEEVAQTRLLRFRGFGLALNDYGQQSSNIKRLTEFPLTYVKIDPELVRSAEYEAPLFTSENDIFVLTSSEVILQSTFDMMSNLNLNIIADGVDDEQSVLHMEQMGCEFMMGHHFGHQMPPGTFYKHIEKFNSEMLSWSIGPEAE